MSPIIEIYKDFTFEASHVLPKHPGKCSRLHGHSWQLSIGVQGTIDPETGFVLDYAVLKDLVTPLIDQLDHQHLGYGNLGDGNKLYRVPSWLPIGFYPSSENLVVAIANHLTPIIKENTNARLYEVSLKETCTSAARYRIPG